MILGTLSEVASYAGILVGVLGVAFGLFQLRRSGAAARAQATIQFQAAFRGSAPARKRFTETFPVHESVLDALTTADTVEQYASWRELSDLDAEHIANAQEVINALNDVAQYVADGLSMRSALQQYHTIFVRTGILLGPYLDARNAPVDGRAQVRWGRRVMQLYNAALDYHRSHYKHRGRELALTRPTADRSGESRLVIIASDGSGAAKHPGYTDEEERPKSTRYSRQVWRAVRRAECKLRR